MIDCGKEVVQGLPIQSEQTIVDMIIFERDNVVGGAELRLQETFARISLLRMVSVCQVREVEGVSSGCVPVANCPEIAELVPTYPNSRCYAHPCTLAFT